MSKNVIKLNASDAISDYKANSYGTLYLIATPIGNISDISIRALEVLQKVQRVICEDTRVTMNLLNHYNIKQKLASYHDFSTPKELETIVKFLRGGQDVAFVSDSGTPLVSDPGYDIVSQAIKNNIKVTSLPGACSAINALIISGLPTHQFTFIGFLPNAEKARKDLLEKYKFCGTTLVFFDTANRLYLSLECLYLVFGERKIAVVREMTKMYEEVVRGMTSDILGKVKSSVLKGEFVVVVEGCTAPILSKEEEFLAMKELLSYMSLKEAVNFAKDSLGMNKKTAYDIAIKLKREID